MSEENNFPRGGKPKTKRPHQNAEHLFTLSKPTKAKKPKNNKKSNAKEASEDAFQSILNIKGTLSYNKIQPGMLILGCISHATNFSLGVQLPGLCFAAITITEISDEYTKHLNNELENNSANSDSYTLNNIFSIGEFVPVKILSIEERDKGTHIEASISPKKIYAELNHNGFNKEMLVWSCVKSVSDHGYEMSVGIKECRAFLPFKNTDRQDYVVGRPFWCVVHKVDSTPSTSIIRLSAKNEHLQKIKSDLNNLNGVIPGTKVEFLVDYITNYGLQGKFFDRFIGYIDENFLGTPLKKLHNYHEGKLLTAYILYTEPSTKITYLTLRKPETEKLPENLKIGDLIKGKVLNQLNNGISFLLPNELKGFATNRRLIKTFRQQDSDKDFKEVINAKYSINSPHQLRILDYNFLQKLFICSPELSLVKEKIFTHNDLRIGQLINTKIVEILEEGILVQMGHVKGFIPNLFISNAEYSGDVVKKKFREGDRVPARVFNIEKEKIILNCKPAFVESENCLANIEEAQLGEKYTGIVVKLNNLGALIAFNGKSAGWLCKSGMGKFTTDPSKYFFCGQVVDTYILRIEDDDRIYLSLFPPAVPLPKIGNIYKGIVTKILENGLEINVDQQKNCFIPLGHLSNNELLCDAIKNSFKPLDEINELMYVGGEEPQIYSLREGKVAATNGNVPIFEDLEAGNILRCFFIEKTERGIRVQPLIDGFTQNVEIYQQKCDDELPELMQYQLLFAKIVKININTRHLILSVKLKDVFQENVEGMLDYFTQRIDGILYLSKHSQRNQLNINKFSPGTQVECKIEKITPNDECLVSLPNGVKGIVVKSLSLKNLKIGDVVPGTVLYQNFDAQFVDVCLKPNICAKINRKQRGNLNNIVAVYRAQKLIVKPDFVICLLQGQDGNEQLVYLPLKRHENDFKKCYNFYENKKFRICVCGKYKRFLIGMSIKLFMELDAKNNRNLVKKIKDNNHLNETDESEEDDENSVEAEEEEEEEDVEDLVEDEPHEVSVVSEAEFQDNKQAKFEAISSEKKISLPGVASLFRSEINKIAVDDVQSSSSDEEDDKALTDKKKIKLTSSERAELLKEEEARILKIEKNLADPNRTPEDAEQFDRLLLAKPDSAEFWAKYVAFHVAATEIDKARAVVKRALDTINMTLVEEKFKIWIVWLNLENIFGTKDSFDSCFNEALKFNDPLDVHLKAIEMLAESGKFSEMEEKIVKVRSKFKQNEKMWMEIGKTYYQIGRFKEARDVKDRALKSIIVKKSQMMIIIRFAIYEFKYGEPDEGSAIFETILMSDPKKINIWITYVDQLVKKNKIDEARQILERAVSFKLPLKSMKTLFLKFRKFEEIYGNENSVEAVKERAQQFVRDF